MEINLKEISKCTVSILSVKYSRLKCRDKMKGNSFDQWKIDDFELSLIRSSMLIPDVFICNLLITYRWFIWWRPSSSVSSLPNNPFVWLLNYWIRFIYKSLEMYRITQYSYLWSEKIDTTSRLKYFKLWNKWLSLGSLL